MVSQTTKDIMNLHVSTAILSLIAHEARCDGKRNCGGVDESDVRLAVMGMGMLKDDILKLPEITSMIKRLFKESPMHVRAKLAEVDLNEENLVENFHKMMIRLMVVYSKFDLEKALKVIEYGMEDDEMETEVVGVDGVEDDATREALKKVVEALGASGADASVKVLRMRPTHSKKTVH